MSRYTASSGAWEHPPQPRPRLSIAWVRLVAVWTIVGLSIALAERAMPSTAALSIEAERQAELYRKGY